MACARLSWFLYSGCLSEFHMLSFSTCAQQQLPFHNDSLEDIFRISTARVTAWEVGAKGLGFAGFWGLGFGVWVFEVGVWAVGLAS